MHLAPEWHKLSHWMWWRSTQCRLHHCKNPISRWKIHQIDWKQDIYQDTTFLGGKSATSRGEVFRELFASKTKIATKAEKLGSLNPFNPSETVDTFSARNGNRSNPGYSETFPVGWSSWNHMLSNYIVSLIMKFPVLLLFIHLHPWHTFDFWSIRGVSHGLHPDQKMLFQSNSQGKKNQHV